MTVHSLDDNYQQKSFSYFQNKRPEMLTYIPDTSNTILDVGCGCGDFGELVKVALSSEVWGVEINTHAIEIASQKLDRVICGDFTNDLGLPERKFDCIIFNDVLEHMIDPFTSLSNAKKFLKHGGVIVASIPNVRYFPNIWELVVKKDWQYSEWGILDRTHLRFFTYRSILSTLDSLGYSVQCIEGINPVEQVHPVYSRKFRIFNLLSFKQIEDMRYLQFAVVARPKDF